MKRSGKELLSWSDRVSMFRPRYEDAETSAYRSERAREMIEKLKRVYADECMLFDYHYEQIRGRFVTAVEADIPGTYTVVLRISSSRICTGPCVLRVGATLIGGIILTGSDGIVGITARIDG
jgi:hypothetical protein